ncbi:peptidylprolyl isomerase [Flavobacterium gelidilacus]|uniref:peptidylprolyl isomerase n=1 Tax=Flavobacterium gelidilacus TaxID=206041 RepID=UPI000416D450|nr:peptidylprolyl isomerase [Flavobacterium gelidilacus]
MKNKFVFGLLFLLQFSNVFSQEVKKEVLFSIDDKPYYTDEFIRVYNKNLDLVKDDSQKDIDVYFDLFLGYKLKVDKAYKVGLQNSLKYQNELKSYRTQLSKNYTSDSKVTKALTEEAYERSLKEIKASHILILVDENALPGDTLKAYNEAVKVVDEIKKGMSFEDAAVKYSQDPSAKDNKGDLGYFSVFRMVYPFESAAFKTTKGTISKPIRTRFGYHIIKVVDQRDNKGEVTVAHIMVLDKKDENGNDLSKKTIDEIYQKIQQGEKFEALAQQFSEDKSSSSKGGVLQRFGRGQLSSGEFEDIAFSLKSNNDVSKPFKTQFGWHIVKLIDKHPVSTYEESKNELENKIRRDDRSKLISSSLTEKLKKKYPVSTDKKVLEAVKKLVNDNFYKQTWEVSPEVIKANNKKLVEINNDVKLNASSFLQYIQEQQKQNLQIKPVNNLVDHLYGQYVDVKLNEYYDDHLENEFVEFKYIMDEYRDGLLLFDLMEKEIWERSKSDTIGQKQFYLDHIDNYKWKKRVETEVYSSSNKSDIEKALKYAKKGKDSEYIKSKLNAEGKVNIMIQKGIYEDDDKTLPKNASLNKGISEIVKEGDYYFFLNTTKVLPSEPKDFLEARGRVINDYQQFLEVNWVSELKKNVDIKVNKDVLEKVKNHLEK